MTFDKGYAAVMLSGGRDSLLAASIAIESGYHIVPVICDNGHIEGIERAKYAVYHLQEVYGANMVGGLVVRKMGYALLQYVQDMWQSRAKALSKVYPEMQMYQAHCLACKSAMYVSVLKFCRYCNIQTLVDGVRRSQGFIVDTDQMVSRFKDFARAHGVVVMTPLMELVSDQDRKRLLNDRGLPTKTLEPQCFLGCPMPDKLHDEEISDLLKFFDEKLSHAMSEDMAEKLEM